MASAPRTPDHLPPRKDSGHEDPAKSGTPSGGTVVPEGDAGKDEGKRPEPVDRDIEGKPRVTRAGMIWTATVAGLILLVLLIIFIAQNQDQVTLRYFGLEGLVNLGLALFIAAVGGGLLTAIAGATRIIQLRSNAHKNRKDRNRKRNKPG